MAGTGRDQPLADIYVAVYHLIGRGVERVSNKCRPGRKKKKARIFMLADLQKGYGLVCARLKFYRMPVMNRKFIRKNIGDNGNQQLSGKP